MITDWLVDLGPGVTDGAKRYCGVRSGDAVTEGVTAIILRRVSET